MKQVLLRSLAVLKVLPPLLPPLRLSSKRSKYSSNGLVLLDLLSSATALAPTSALAAAQATPSPPVLVVFAFFVSGLTAST